MAGTRGPRSSSALLERVVLGVFDGSAALTRPQLMEATGLSRPTVAAVVAALVARGDLTELAEPAATGTRGRPSLTYRRTALAAPVALVRLTHREPTRVSLVGDDGPGTAVDTGVSWTKPWAEWAPPIRAALAELESAVPVPARRVVIAAPFPVREGHGAPELHPRAAPHPANQSASAPDWPAPHIADWLAHDPRPAVAELLGRPVSLINDANLAALGEARYGAARGAHSVVHLSIRHGVGAGLVIGGTLVPGAHGMAGEIGHVQVADDGPYCLCGNRGCLVTQSFDPFKIDALIGRYGGAADFRDIEGLVAHGDAVALRFFRDLGALLAKPLSTLAVMLDPDMVVIDAELGRTVDPLIAGLKAELARRCSPQQADDLSVLRGELADAVGYGALAAANNASAAPRA
ncbi:MAG TPA: ROK family protein [Actinocrinis sp.]